MNALRRNRILAWIFLAILAVYLPGLHIYTHYCTHSEVLSLSFDQSHAHLCCGISDKEIVERCGKAEHSHSEQEKSCGDHDGDNDCGCCQSDAIELRLSETTYSVFKFKAFALFALTPVLNFNYSVFEHFKTKLGYKNLSISPPPISGAERLIRLSCFLI